MIPTERERERVPRGPMLREDTRSTSMRIAMFQYIACAVFLYLVSGFWNLQVRNPEQYQERARQNRIKAVPIPAQRGRILDRDGRVLVDSLASYSLILSRENLTDSQLKVLSEGLDLDYESLRERVANDKRPKYEPIFVKEELTPGELSFVEAHRGDEGFPEMELIQAPRRIYPRDGLAAHLVGYTGEVSEAELNTLEFVRYKQGDVIGKAGLEREYNSRLMGTDGQRRVLVDNRGREKQVLGVEEAVPGEDLRLTLDLDVQSVAELAMEGRRGAVVALDPRSGEVLAMVSRPAFDPNKFAGRIRPAGWWNQIVNDPEKPLLNRAIQAQLAPGSTFKPIVGIAALETGAINLDFTTYCNGHVTLYGHVYHCHRLTGHGLMTFTDALAESCDSYFYQLGARLQIDQIARYAEMAGFGSRTGIDLPAEATGLVPSTQWRRRTTREPWYDGETISVAIGQGPVTVTPLQLAYAIGGLAIGGEWHQPHLAMKPNAPVTTRTEHFERANLQAVMEGMCKVVEDGGTGTQARIPGIEVCGKTGTAQLVSNSTAVSAEAADKFKDNTWFVGLAPRQNPEIVVAVLFEGGVLSSRAAAIARDVMKAYFDKKERLREDSDLYTQVRPSTVPVLAGSQEAVE